MSWLQKLYETYDNCAGEVGKNVEVPGAAVLAPVGQMNQRVQVEIKLDVQAEIISAKVLASPDEQNTLIPCTEDSQNRTSAPCAHVLFDKLQYMAGDYFDYFWLKKDEEVTDKIRKDRDENKKKTKEALTVYKCRLEDLCKCSSGAVKKRLEIIVQYLNKNCLIGDLVERSILIGSAEDHRIMLNTDLKKDTVHPLYRITSDVSGIYVRLGVHLEGELADAIWEMPEFWETFNNYYLSHLQKERGADLCYVLGKKTAPGLKHLCRIPFTDVKAKLLSSNDATNFTYRGRFDEPSEAMCVGYETSQKAFNALRWLVLRQSYHENGQIYVIWATKNQKVPQVFDDSLSLLSEGMDYDDLDDEVDTAEIFAKKMIKAMKGYKKELDDSAQVVMMGMDAATPGRLAVTYYQEVTGSDFLERLEHWHGSCQWLHRYKWIKTDEIDPSGKPRYKNAPFYGAPAPKDIIEAAYQTSRAAKVPEKFFNATMDRLVPCILEKAPLPLDIVRTLAHRASNPPALEPADYERVLTIACAFIRKYHNDLKKRSNTENKKEEIRVALQPDLNDRSYQFGRLLAYAQNIESFVNRAEDINRMTNAERLMHQFVKKPMKTWGIVELQLIPYRQKMQKVNWGLYQRLMTEMNGVMSKISGYNSTDIHKPLSELYLLGYRCQLEQFQKDIQEAVKMKEQKKENATQADIKGGE